MLLDDSPANLLQATLQNFTTQPDKLAVSRVNDSLSTLAQSRSLRIHDAETALRKLSRQLNTISSQHKQTLGEHDATSHAREVVELDSRKFRVAKGLSELEQEGERLQSELARLKARLAELDEQGVEGDVQAKKARQAEDPTVLRLWIYRSLGVSLEQDEVGNYSKAIINNTKRGDVHVVNIDPKFSRWFYADYLWGTMQG